MMCMSLKHTQTLEFLKLHRETLRFGKVCKTITHNNNNSKKNKNIRLKLILSAENVLKKQERKKKI